MFVHEIDGVLDSCPFPAYDAHGNMVLTIARTGTSETNPAYTSSNRRAFDVWGSVRASADLGNRTNKQRYCANLGHVEDDESGLIYMRARYYEPWTGRFVSEDPARDGTNWYTYCPNSPVVYLDESGKEPNFAGTLHMLRTEWRYSLRISSEFRRVATAFVIMWASWLASDIVYDAWDRDILREFRLMHFVYDLEQDVVTVKASALAGSSIRHRLEAFYSGYGVAIEITMFILNNSEDMFDSAFIWRLGS